MRAIPIRDSWRRRGHAPDCWRIHEECALRSAKDMCDTRIAQFKAQSQVFHTGLQKLNDGVDAVENVVLARKLLRDYHQAMKALAREER